MPIPSPSSARQTLEGGEEHIEAISGAIDEFKHVEASIREFEKLDPKADGFRCTKPWCRSPTSSMPCGWTCRSASITWGTPRRGLLLWDDFHYSIDSTARSSRQA